MAHLWLKAFHIAAAMTWVGGMLTMSLAISVVSASSQSRSPVELRIIKAVRRWDSFVSSPAMLLTWALGLAMAVQAGWFTAPWLMLKLALVIVLSALHGMQSGTLRRLARVSDRRPPALLRYSGPPTLAAVTAIAILAVTKPF